MISVYTVAYLEPKAGLPRSGGENSCNGLNFETEMCFFSFFVSETMFGSLSLECFQSEISLNLNFIHKM